MRRQHRADLHVGQVAALALVEADQHRALLGHVAHRQPCPVAVAPGRPLDRPQDGLGPELAQVPEVVFQHPLLDRHLRHRVQVLHLAAAAGTGVQPEVRTARTDPLRRFAVDRGERGHLPVVLALEGAGLDPFGGERALDEHHLAVGPARDALGFQVERIDLQRPGRHARVGDAGGGGMGSRRFGRNRGGRIGGHVLARVGAFRCAARTAAVLRCGEDRALRNRVAQGVASHPLSAQPGSGRGRPACPGGGSRNAA